MAILYKGFKSLRTVFCALLVCFLCVAPPVGAAGSVFTVKDVRVDITADNALSARDQAFALAQRKSFKILADRMLSQVESDTFVMPHIQAISSLIQDYEITEEKLSDVRYIGTYTFRFKDKAVQKYFSGSGVQYTDVSSKPVLILPFYQHNGQTILWSPYNVWMQAWNRASDLGGLVPVTVPLGDLSDVKDIGEDEALSYDKEGLANMIVRYGAGEAVLVIAMPEENGGIAAHIYRTDRADPEFVQKITVPVQGSQTNEEVLDTAVKRVYRTFQQDWKRRTLVSSHQANKLQVRVRFNNLQQWADTQRALGRVHGVNEVALKSLSPKSARVDLLFQGTESRLRLALQQADMTLSSPRISMDNFGNNANFGAPLVYELYLNRYAPYSRKL